MDDIDIIARNDAKILKPMDIEVFNESHILLQDKEFNLAIQDSCGKTYFIKANMFEKIYDLKEKLFHKNSLKLDYQHLYYNGIELDNEAMLQHLDLNYLTVLNLINDLKGGMQIFIKSVEGKIFTLEITSNETVENIKNKIYEKSGISPKLIKLVFVGTILNNDEIIKNTNITNESIINMVTLLSDQISITIQLPMNKSAKLQVYKQDTIYEVKRQIFQSTNIEIQNQKLLCNRQILKDNRTLANYEIEHDDSINLIVDANGNLLIFIIIGLVLAFVTYEIIRHVY